MNTLPESLQHIASCITGYDPNALPVAQAQQFIARLVNPVEAVEMLPIRSSLGRVLARDVVSPIDVPAADNSAMDGYALRGADLAPAAETRLRKHRQRASPARPSTAASRPGQCVRIMTGAVMPAGLDTVVPQEFVQVDGDAGHRCRPARCGAATTGASPARTWRPAPRC